VKLPGFPSGSRPLWIVVAACLAMNVAVGALIAVDRPAYLADYRLSTDPDSLHYVLLGQNTLLHGHFSRCQEPPYLPDAFRTPVYPIFAGGLDLIGRAGTVYLAQAIVHVGSCVLLFLLVRPIFGLKAAFWSALLLATDLTLVIYNFQVMSEPLFVFFLLASAVVFLPVILAPQGGPYRVVPRALIGGLLLGLAILVRPAGFYLPVVIAIGCTGAGLLQKRTRAAVGAAAVFVAVAMVPVGCWIARNHVLFSVSSLTHNQPNVLVYFFGAGAYQVEHGMTLEEAQAAIAEEYEITPVVEVQNAHEYGHDVARIEAEQRAVMWKVVGKYPRSLAKSSAAALVKAHLSHATDTLGAILGQKWAGPGREAVVGDPAGSLRRLAQNGPALTTAFLWQMGHVGAVLLVALLGVVATVRNRRVWPAGIMLLLVLAYFYLTVMLFGYEAYCRCRIPLVPFLYVFAGYGISRLLPKSPDSAEHPGAT